MDVLIIIGCSIVNVLVDFITLLVETFKVIAYIITLVYMLDLIRKDMLKRKKRRKESYLRQKGAIQQDVL